MPKVFYPPKMIAARNRILKSGAVREISDSYLRERTAHAVSELVFLTERQLPVTEGKISAEGWIAKHLASEYKISPETAKEQASEIMNIWQKSLPRQEYSEVLRKIREQKRKKN